MSKKSLYVVGVCLEGEIQNLIAMVVLMLSPHRQVINYTTLGPLAVDTRVSCAFETSSCSRG